MKAWISAMRLRTLPLALSCILMGTGVASLNAEIDWSIFGWAILTTILLQVLSNFANDYGDFSHGVDNEQRVGPQRAMQSGAIDAASMKKALIICSLLALVSGIILLYHAFDLERSFGWFIGFLVLGLSAIFAAIKYTAGKNPYGYRALGDVAVFLFFGIIGVFGTAFLYNNTMHLEYLLPAIFIGSFSAAVLNLNNMRDHANDAAQGKKTLAVIWGLTRTKHYHLRLFIYGLIGLTVYIIALGHYALLLSFLALWYVPIHLIKVFREEDPKNFDPELKKIALITFFTSLIFFIVAINL